MYKMKSSISMTMLFDTIILYGYAATAISSCRSDIAYLASYRFTISVERSVEEEEERRRKQQRARGTQKKERVRVSECSCAPAAAMAVRHGAKAGV